MPGTPAQDTDVAAACSCSLSGAGFAVVPASRGSSGTPSEALPGALRTRRTRVEGGLAVGRPILSCFLACAERHVVEAAQTVLAGARGRECAHAMGSTSNVVPLPHRNELCLLTPCPPSFRCHVYSPQDRPASGAALFDSSGFRHIAWTFASCSSRVR